MIREHSSYRANGHRLAIPARVKDRSYKGLIKLNRSQRWPRAKSYAHAREISPSAEPVR